MKPLALLKDRLRSISSIIPKVIEEYKKEKPLGKFNKRIFILTLIFHVELLILVPWYMSLIVLPALAIISGKIINKVSKEELTPDLDADSLTELAWYILLSPSFMVTFFFVYSKMKEMERVEQVEEKINAALK